MLWFTVFPRILSFDGTYPILNWDIAENSNSCLINGFFSAENIQGQKLYREIRYEVYLKSSKSVICQKPTSNKLNSF